MNKDNIICDQCNAFYFPPNEKNTPIFVNREINFDTTLGLGPSRPTWWGASRTTQAPYPAADGSPVRLVRLNGGHKDREEDEEMRTGRRRWTGRRRRTEAAVLDINTILLVRKKLLIQTERLCKI